MHSFSCARHASSSAIVLKPSTLLHLHSVLRKRKYRMLFSPERRHRSGPKGPTKELSDAVVAMKQHNPRWGCPRVAHQIGLAFGVEIDKDVVRRILNVHYPRQSDSGGPSWLSSWPYQGHSMERRFIPLRIGNAANTLGSRHNGSIYTTHYRV